MANIIIKGLNYPVN